MVKVELREGHKYWIGNKCVVGVNEILQAGGFIDFDRVNPLILERAQLFGSAVHKAVALFTAKKLNIATLDDALRPYLSAWRKWMDTTGFKPLCCEDRMYSKQWGFAGTPDQPGMIGKRYVLVDYKSSTTLSPVTALQLAGYEILMREKFKIKDNQKVERIAVKLGPDGEPKPTCYKELRDRAIFLSALNCYKWRKINGLLKEAK